MAHVSRVRHVRTLNYHSSRLFHQFHLLLATFTAVGSRSEASPSGHRTVVTPQNWHTGALSSPGGEDDFVEGRSPVASPLQPSPSLGHLDVDSPPRFELRVQGDPVFDSVWNSSGLSFLESRVLQVCNTAGILPSVRFLMILGQGFGRMD